MVLRIKTSQSERLSPQAAKYRGDYLGVKQTTQRIKAVEDMLARKGVCELLTPVNKAKWTKLLEHNKIDVLGMKKLVYKSIGSELEVGDL